MREDILEYENLADNLSKQAAEALACKISSNDKLFVESKIKEFLIKISKNLVKSESFNYTKEQIKFIDYTVAKYTYKTCADNSFLEMQDEIKDNFIYGIASYIYITLRQYIENGFSQEVMLKKIEDCIKFYYLSQINYYNQEFQQALIDINNALQKDQTNIYFLQERANIYYNLGLYEDALKDLDLIISIVNFDIDMSGLYYKKAAIYRTIGDNKQEVENYKKVISINPEHVDAYISLGIAYMQTEEYVLARECFDSAIQKDSKNDCAYINRAKLKTAVSEYTAAIEDLNMAKTLNENNPDIYFDLSLNYYLLEKYKQSLEYINKSIDLDNKNEYAYYNRAKCKYNLGDLNGAENDYSYAISLNKNYLKAYINRAVIYVDLNNFTSALKDLLFGVSYCVENNIYNDGINELIYEFGKNSVAECQVGEKLIPIAEKLPPFLLKVHEKLNKISDYEYPRFRIRDNKELGDYELEFFIFGKSIKKLELNGNGSEEDKIKIIVNNFESILKEYSLNIVYKLLEEISKKLKK